MEQINNINLSQCENDNIKSIYLVIRIYEFVDHFLDEELELDQLIVGENIFDIINTINFVYSKESKNINNIHKVGFLRNLQVFLDPNKKDNNIIFTNDNKDTRILEIEF